MSGVQQDADVAVIGLGGIGAMAAWRLAERGLRVHGYEQFGIGHDRGAAAGQTRRLSVQSQRERRMTPLALDAVGLWRSLEALTGAALLHQVGGVIIGPAGTPSLESARRSAEEYGLDHEVLDPADLARRFPEHLSRPGDLGVTDPYAGYLRPELAVVTAVSRAQERGAEIFAHTRVLAVEPDADGVVVRSESGTRRYGHVVTAPGAWAREVLPAAADTVVARRLVQAWYLARNPAAYRPEVFPVFERVGDVNAYGFPSLDGATVKVGIYTAPHPLVHDMDTRPMSVGVRLVRQLAATIGTYFPGLRPDPVATAVGFEAYTTDGMPLLGPVPYHPRVVLACGFSGSGFKFAPVMGDIAADWVLDGATKRDIPFLSPSRELTSWPPEALTRA